MSSHQRLTDRKRAAIIEAAIAEFRANGFDATSVDKVATRAEVSKRTLYNHFSSKDELFAEILRIVLQSGIGRQELVYHPDEPIGEQLFELLMKKMTAIADDNFLDLVRVAIAAFIHSPDRAQDIINRIGEKESSLLSWIKAAQKDGRVKSGDAVFMTQQLESLVKGMAFWPQVTMGQPKLTVREQKKVAKATADLFLSYYAV